MVTLLKEKHGKGTAINATSFTATLILAITLAAAASPVSASPITIAEFEFELDQFSDAHLTVSEGVIEDDDHWNDFDNNFYIDPDESDRQV